MLNQKQVDSNGDKKEDTYEKTKKENVFFFIC